jgi:polyhydroxyalkanoate synthase subunit PhaC
MNTSDNFSQIFSNLQNAGKHWIDELAKLPLPKDAEQLQAMWVNAFGGASGSFQELSQTLIMGQEKWLHELVPNSPKSADDKRFQGSDWQETPQFRLLADSYLATASALLASLDSAQLSAPEKKRAKFFLKQYLDAVAPSNFLATNPEALRLAVETKGESLREGAKNLSDDAAKGHVSITDENAFVVGKNIAVSPGAVVFENELFQLIQYTPLTPTVFLRPLLFVPPCINKYYILDLTPENSLVRFMVAQGHTVFVMSWRNVDASLATQTWDDYIANGVVKAIDTVRLITNVERINTLGFCVGGTLLACALAVLRRTGHDVVESTTFLTTFVDFTDVGDIDAYIDEAFIARREREVGGGGVVNGSELAFAFSSLRANDLIWSYVVSNYLKGSKPPAFDLLYWNADSTNLPGPWYCWYVRNTYVENNLIHPDKVDVCGTPVDMGYVDMPAFVFAAKEDHIVPWRSAYRSAASFSGDVHFTLGASGHIAGVVNPAAKNKRSFWSQAKASGQLPASPEAWLEGAVETPGSWWTRWADWIEPFGGRRISARHALGNTMFPKIESAPGSYVVEKAR